MEYPGDGYTQPRPNQRRGGGAPSAGPFGGPRGGNGPTVAMTSAKLNGDDIHVGRRRGQRRRTRSSQSESQGSGAEEEWSAGVAVETVSFYGLQGERVWYGGRGARQLQAERGGNSHQPGAAAAAATSASPKRGGSRTLTFRSRRPQQPPPAPEEEHASPRRQPGVAKGRSTSSEPYRGRGRGYRGGRRRGYSETEGRPRRDNVIMSGLQCLAQENIWFDKSRYDEAERRFYEGANGPAPQVKTAPQPGKRPQKRQHRNSSSHAGDQELVSRMKSLELENQGLHKVVTDLRAALSKLESRVSSLEKTPSAPVPCAKAAPLQQVKVVENGGDDDDDDMDLFGSDDEDDEEAERIKEERVKAYTARKSTKPALIPKSSILLDVKPWDDETDMSKLEECVRTVQMDGLLWGTSKLVPVGYGIKKLQIACVVEDDKVGTDILEEEITKFEDYVQSVDIAAFNKI